MDSVIHNNDTSSHFFEGAEKLLEIWFEPDNTTDERQDLRLIERIDWVEVLKTVNCEIINKSSVGDLDSYILSESSMFVSKTRFILKTCGRTMLLNAVRPVLQLATAKCGFSKVLDVFYSRKNFKRPELQRDLHRSFDKEVQFLDDIFTDVKSSAYQIGNIKSECWHLYTLHSHLPATVPEPDQTLEVIMTSLDPECMRVFYRKEGDSAQHATKASGIRSLLPDAHIDDFLFDPCGYSMNAVSNEGFYSTIHITPEQEFSYVSFETNIPQADLSLIERVLSLFKPRSFIITLFSNNCSPVDPVHKQLLGSRSMLHFQRHDHFLSQLKNYHCTYAHYAALEPEGHSSPPLQ